MALSLPDGSLPGSAEYPWPYSDGGGSASSSSPGEAEGADEPIGKEANRIVEAVSTWCEDDEEAADENTTLRKAFVLLLSIVIIPMSCRLFHLAPAARCGLVICSMLIINLAKVMPLFTTALFVPVLGTLCSVLGDAHSVKDTSTLLVANIFNNTSFMVLGALVINGIFLKCGLDTRFMQMLLRTFSLEGPMFLFCLVLGGTLLCSVLYSGSLVLVTAMAGPLERRVKNKTLPANAAKRILLGAAFAANAGSTVLPISSPVTLITVSLLNDFGYDIPINTWVSIAMPVVMFTMVASWIMLLILFPVEKVDENTQVASRETCDATSPVQITDWHMIFLGVGFAAVLGITVYAEQLEPIIGHSACLSLALVVIVFGSGFMTRDEFCGLDWDILALVGGTNVVAFMVRETGLGVELADGVVKAGIVEVIPYHGLLAILVVFTMCCSTLLQHSITGVLLMPLVVAIGIKLQAAETTAILVAIAVPLGMGLNYSSFDNQISHRASAQLGRRSARLTDKDWRRGGVCTSIFGGILILTMGYHASFRSYKLPPPVWVIEHMTPEELRPKIARENRRSDDQFGGSAFLSLNHTVAPMRPFGATAALLSVDHAAAAPAQPLGAAAARLAAARPRRLRQRQAALSIPGVGRSQAVQ